MKKGKEGTADATFTLTDDDAAGLFDGSLKPNTLFMQGKMKIKGNMQAAMKFTPDLFPKSKLWCDCWELASAVLLEIEYEKNLQLLRVPSPIASGWPHPNGG